MYPSKVFENCFRMEFGNTNPLMFMTSVKVIATRRGGGSGADRRQGIERLGGPERLGFVKYD